VACPGAVSLSASKAVLSFSKSIVVDTSESSSLPPAVKEAYLKGGASIPIVILTDPAMENIFGTFNHPQMESQKYDSIFRDARSKIKKSLKNGTFALGKGNEPKIVPVENSAVETWISSKGSEIEAKLVGIENDQIYLFETPSGKKIRATSAQLSPKSVKKARLAAGLN